MLKVVNTKVLDLTFHPDYIPILRDHFNEYTSKTLPYKSVWKSTKYSIFYYPDNTFKLIDIWPFQLLFVVRIVTNKEDTLTRAYASKFITKTLNEEFNFNETASNYMVVDSNRFDYFVLKYNLLSNLLKK